MRARTTKAYMRGYGALFGDALNDAPQKRSSLKSNRRRSQEESDEQIIASAWMKKKGVVHHHSPNGGSRNALEGAKLKRMGTSAGYPDFHIPYSRKGFHALYIELKRKDGGKLSDRQKWWRDFLLRGGNAWYEAKGADEAIRIIADYMGLEDK